VFERYFSFSLARTIKAVRQTTDFQRPQPIGQNAISMEVFLTGKRVADIMIKNLLTCAPYISVQSAAKMMARRRVSSIVVTGNGLYPLGIMTDNDLRTKVLAAGLSPEVAVAGIMSQPVQTVSPGADAFDALLVMSHHGVSLLVVVEGDHMVGIISEHDLQMEAGSSPLQVIDEIRRTTSLDMLIGMRYKIDSVLEMMLRQGGPVKQLVALVTDWSKRRWNARDLDPPLSRTAGWPWAVRAAKNKPCTPTRTMPCFLPRHRTAMKLNAKNGFYSLRSG
jgi:CBS domain-containing protein